MAHGPLFSFPAVMRLYSFEASLPTGIDNLHSRSFRFSGNDFVGSIALSKVGPGRQLGHFCSGLHRGRREYPAEGTMNDLIFRHQLCPFCGSKDLAARDSEDIDDSVLHAIWCRACDAAGPLVAGDADRAWSAWDLRTETEQAWLGPERRGTSHPLSEDLSLRGLAKACPFCGHRELKCDDAEGGPSSIACLTCEASAVAERGGGEAALEVWNRRAR